MDNLKKQQLEKRIEQLVSEMRKKGMSDKQISDMVLKIVAEVEMEVTEELYEKLPDDKKALLAKMTEENKSSEEIGQALAIDPAIFAEVEERKFNEVIDYLLPQDGSTGGNSELGMENGEEDVPSTEVGIANQEASQEEKTAEQTDEADTAHAATEESTESHAEDTPPSPTAEDKKDN